MQPFTSLGHINLKVLDLEASVDFYAKLGFPEFLRLTQADDQPWIVFLRITEELYIELMPGGIGRAGDTEATGLNHLCLTTPDIEATAAHLAKVGISLVTPFEPSSRGLDDNRGTWIADPDGNRIEIMEMSPDCAQYQALSTLKATGKPTVLKRPI